MTEQDRDATNGAGEAAATPLDGRSVDLVKDAPPAKAPLKLGGVGGPTMITDAAASPAAAHCARAPRHRRRPVAPRSRPDLPAGRTRISSSSAPGPRD